MFPCFSHLTSAWRLYPFTTPTLHSQEAAKQDGWSISTEDWTNPHGPIMSLEEHTAEVMMWEGSREIVVVSRGTNHHQLSHAVG